VVTVRNDRDRQRAPTHAAGFFSGVPHCYNRAFWNRVGA